VYDPHTLVLSFPTRSSGLRTFLINSLTNTTSLIRVLLFLFYSRSLLHTTQSWNSYHLNLQIVFGSIVENVLRSDFAPILITVTQKPGNGTSFCNAMPGRSATGRGFRGIFLNNSRWYFNLAILILVSIEDMKSTLK